MKRLLRIGDMARLGGVSVKALRFYDEQGLLSPEYVDPKTGYRHYTLRQTETLSAITNLRAIDFSVAEIASLLSEGAIPPDRFAEAIATKQRQLRAEQAEIETKIQLAGMLAELQSASDNAAAPSFRIAIPSAQRVYAHRARVPHLGRPVTEIFEETEGDVAQAKARAPLSPLLLFHDAPTSKTDIDIEVCIPVEATMTGDGVKTLKGGGASIAAVYSGGYETTDILFDRITARLAKAGFQTEGPTREIYHRFGADQDDYRLPAKMIAKHRNDYLTEVQVPVSIP